MTDTPEYAENWARHRRTMLFGSPFVLLFLVAGLIQGVIWWTVLGAVGVVIGLLNFWILFRNKPAPNTR